MCILHFFLHSVWESRMNGKKLCFNTHVLSSLNGAICGMGRWELPDLTSSWRGKQEAGLIENPNICDLFIIIFLHMKCDFWPLVLKSRPIAYIWGIHCISKTVNTDHRNKILRQHSLTNILQNAKHERPWSSSFLCRLKKMQDTEDSRSYWQL